MTNISKKRGPIDRTFVAEFQGQRVQLFAVSLGAAKQSATEYFRPKKRDKDALSVVQQVRGS